MLTVLFFVNFIFGAIYEHSSVTRPRRYQTLGIILAPSATEKPDMGEVVAVGAGKIGKDGSRRALDVKVGDKVIFGKYSGQTVKADGVELLVMREEDIFGIVE